MSANPESVNKQNTCKLPDIWKEAIDVDDFIKMELPKRPMILAPWLRKSSLVMVYAYRGVGKTWFALSIALSITTGAPIGSWGRETPTGVLYVDGEMAADEMQENIKSLSATLPPRSAQFKILSSDLLHQNNFSSVNISQLEWRKQIEDALSSQNEIGVLILDNLSCLSPGTEENDKNAFDVISQWMIGLRHKGITVILLHHAGKGGDQRGTSGREDALDIVIKLTRPPGHKPSDGAKVIVSFEKSRGVYGSGISDFTFSLGDDEEGNLIWLTDVPISSSNKEEIIALLGEGKTPNEIMVIVGGSKQNISKHKQWAVERGYLFENIKTRRISFTEIGQKKYAAYITDI